MSVAQRFRTNGCDRVVTCSAAYFVIRKITFHPLSLVLSAKPNGKQLNICLRRYGRRENVMDTMNNTKWRCCFSTGWGFLLDRRGSWLIEGYQRLEQSKGYWAPLYLACIGIFRGVRWHRQRESGRKVQSGGSGGCLMLENSFWWLSNENKSTLLLLFFQK